MSRIVTVNDFCRYSSRRDLNADELARVLDTAEQAVDASICGRLDRYDSFPDRVKENVRKAICAQADYIAANFGADIAESAPQSASIGSFSYSLGGSEAVGSSPATLDLVALTYLRTTGLLYRGGIDAI